jgi:hypothetical protein
MCQAAFGDESIKQTHCKKKQFQTWKHPQLINMNLTMYIIIGTNLFVMFCQVEIFRIIAAPTSSCCSWYCWKALNE